MAVVASTALGDRGGRGDGDGGDAGEHQHRVRGALEPDVAARAGGPDALQCCHCEDQAALATAARCVSRLVQRGARAYEFGDDAGLRRGVDRSCVELGGSAELALATGGLGRRSDVASGRAQRSVRRGVRRPATAAAAGVSRAVNTDPRASLSGRDCSANVRDGWARRSLHL
jgi:hypothetical protein